MDTVETTADLRQRIRAWRAEGLSIGFVPTMGNLHAGHLSLLERARERCDRTVVSIFVNPIQFGQGEDYQRYPSTLDADREKLAAAGLDLLFTPDLTQLYPGGTQLDTRVTVPALEHILCGAFRPGHFSGVATVVTKLFSLVQPDQAFFGEKDFQQVLVIRRTVEDLFMPVDIIAMPIVREADGLAMSSRNVYLNPVERALAPVIHRTLLRSAARLAGGEPVTDIEAEGAARLAEAGLKVEYYSVRRAVDLAEPGPADCELVILTAAWLGSARLIDNIRVERAQPAGD